MAAYIFHSLRPADTRKLSDKETKQSQSSGNMVSCVNTPFHTPITSPQELPQIRAGSSMAVRAVQKKKRAAS